MVFRAIGINRIRSPIHDSFAMDVDPNMNWSACLGTYLSIRDRQAYLGADGIHPHAGTSLFS